MATVTTDAPRKPLTVDSLEDARRIVDILLSSVPALGVVVVDPDLRIRLMDGDARTYGMDRATVVGDRLADAFTLEAWEAVESLWWAALGGETTTLEWASLDRTSDCWLRISPLSTPAGAVVGAMMIAHDIAQSWEAFRQLERRAERQTAIAAIGTQALQGMPAADLIEEATRLIKAMLGADVAAVTPYNAVGGLEVRGLTGEIDLDEADLAAPSVPGQIMDHMRDAEGPLVIDDLALGTLRAPVLEAAGMRSLIVAPIGPPAARYGLLGACSRTAGAFKAEALAFLQSMANTLAGAVAVARVSTELRHRESLLNEAQVLADVGSWELSLETGVSTLSGHLRHMLGVPEGSFDADAFLARVPEDDRLRLGQVIADTIAGQAGEPTEFRLAAPAGGERILLSRSTEVSDTATGARTVRGTVQDITETRRAEQDLRRSEERFRQGFDNAPIGMTLVDPGSGRYLRVNDAYCRMLGRTAAELLDMTYHGIVHPDDPAVRERNDYVDGKTTRISTEGRYLHADGSSIWASINSSPVVGPDGEVDVLFSQVVDITERHEREEKVQRELEQIGWVQEIHAALAEDRFELYAQPIVDLASGLVIQQELLLRMRTPDGALVLPGEFLAVAEQYGVIRDIDRWVIGRGAELAAGGASVEINISGTSMGDVGVIEEIDRALERTGADPSLLVFEITETAVIEDMENAHRLAHRLRERGCRFALDDFGTGFAGMSSLKRLPLDFLKIDRDFVKDLCTSETDRQVLSASVNLARAFGLKTIAEGVEDQATLDILREFGVDHAQGYFLGRPAPFER